MYDCIENLIATQDEAGNFLGWMKVQDEQYIELLCRLLHTVGRKLEESANDDHYTKFNWYFLRLQELSSDKSLNSRIRFSLEEVIQLRANGWQSRREEEGIYINIFLYFDIYIYVYTYIYINTYIYAYMYTPRMSLVCTLLNYRAC
jgi:hypothetical protein